MSSFYEKMWIVAFVMMWIFKKPFRFTLYPNSRSASASSNHSADVIVQYTNNVSSIHPNSSIFSFFLQFCHIFHSFSLIFTNFHEIFPNH